MIGCGDFREMGRGFAVIPTSLRDMGHPATGRDYQEYFPVMNMSRQTRPAAIFIATPSQKSGGRSDRLIDPKFSQTVPVDKALLSSQRQTAPVKRDRNLTITG